MLKCEVTESNKQIEMPKKETYNVRVLLEGEMAKRFEAVKRFYGLQKNADLVRLLITLKYEDITKEK